MSEDKKPNELFRFRLECNVKVNATGRTDAYTKLAQTLDSHHAVKFMNTVIIENDD